MQSLDLTSILLLFASVLNFGLGLTVFLKDSPYRRVNVSFSIFSWALGAWALSILLIYLIKEPSWRVFCVRMSFAASSLVPASFFYFSLVFPRQKRHISSVKAILISVPAFAFGVISFTKWMVHSVHWQTLSSRYGTGHSFFLIYVLTGMFGGIYFLAKSYKHSFGLERIQIKYCFLGTFTLSLTGVLFNLILPTLGTSRLSHLGPATTLIMVSFITYAILKHRLMDINIVLRKGTTYVLLLLLLFVPSVMLILFSQEVYFKQINYLFSAVIIALLFLVAFLFHEIKPGTEKAVEYFLFKNKYDYRETLGKFSKAMVSILDLQSLSKRIIDTISQTMGVGRASLYLLNEEKGGYTLQESKNIKVTSPAPMFTKEDSLPFYLQKIGEIIIREELMKGGNFPELKKVVEQMTLLEAEASIPLISKGRLIGMINLGEKLNKDIYYHEDIEMLSTLANQTSIAIENARLYEDLKQSKSYIRRADRLASLGTLTAGLAHEIRNPLVAIKTFTQLLPERLEDEEFRNHFLNIASSEVDRISSLIGELLEFARPSDPKFEYEDINSILDGMLLLVSTETKKKQVHIAKSYEPDVPLVNIDREQIKQVFLNVLLNAIEATGEAGQITIKTRSFEKPGGERYIQIEVTDTGHGIPAEHLEDIFTPFFTTKSKGSGLGLSISHQIVQDHRGYIDVKSEVNKGTSFFINLPLRQEHPQRRMEDLMSQREILNSLERR